MPNIRQMRQRVRKTKKWSKEAMKQAMQEVQAGRLKIRQASKQFGVPKSSLSDRLTGRVATDCVQGQPPLLTPQDERSLVEYCLYNASHGYPQRKDQVVAKALAIYNFRHPHKPRTVLGQTWWINFKERNQCRLTSHVPAITDHGKKSRTRSGSLKDFPFSRLPVPDCPPLSPSSDTYLTHPLIASGCVTGELARVLSKTNQTCESRNLRRSAHVLTAQQMSDVIKKVEDSAAGTAARSVKRQGPEDGANLAVSSSTLPGSGAADPSAVLVPTCASHSASSAPSSTPTSKSVSSNDQHDNIGDAFNLWQSSVPPAPPSSSGSSASCTAEPTTSTRHIARKKRKLEKKILRCGRCGQPYPPKEPEGLVLYLKVESLCRHQLRCRQQLERRCHPDSKLRSSRCNEPGGRYENRERTGQDRTGQDRTGGSWLSYCPPACRSPLLRLWVSVALQLPLVPEKTLQRKRIDIQREDGGGENGNHKRKETKKDKNRRDTSLDY